MIPEELCFLYGIYFEDYSLKDQPEKLVLILCLDS